MNTGVVYAWHRAVLLAAISLLLVVDKAQGQTCVVTHFVAPIYPALARQAMISGQVVLMLVVGGDGKILNINEESSSHPLLTQHAKAAISEWDFPRRPRRHPVSVTVYFAFSGKTREYNPVTTVTADFAPSAVRVYVTTDGVPTVRQ